MDLKSASTPARRARLMILDGVDPIEERKARLAAQKLEITRTTTFAQAAEQFMQTDAVCPLMTHSGHGNAARTPPRNPLLS